MAAQVYLLVIIDRCLSLSTSSAFYPTLRWIDSLATAQTTPSAPAFVCGKNMFANLATNNLGGSCLVRSLLQFLDGCPADPGHGT